jgi:hypothetical protein
VLVDEVKPESLKPPVKGKKVNTVELRENLSKALRDWGGWGKVYMKAALL